jgi:imidazolonepropionase-like amidohydrolase
MAEEGTMANVLLENARLFDGHNEECPEGQQILIEGGEIREIGESLQAQNVRTIDVGGRTVMPGLIDAHVHAVASDINVQKIDLAGEPYRTAHAIRMLGHALDCGFTSVRDVGGGDYSLWRAIEDRLIRAPRFFYAGRILSMTGGHGDFRQMSESRHNHGYCSCGPSNSACVIADGVDECIKAVREELRRGAHCIKIMASGGVASPTDPIWMNQYREDEIRAIVNETRERRSYTAAHCHPASAVRRSVECGVRSIEHGTLIDDDTARYVAVKGAYIVPTMVIIFVLVELGKKMGFPASNQEKAEYAYRQALAGMESMRKAGVKVGFGTDLLGETYVQQCREFTIRREVFSPVEILRQATSVNAEILQQQGRLGCIRVGAQADLLVVDGDPLVDIGLLADSGKHLRLIMRGGELIKDQLH